MANYQFRNTGYSDYDSAVDAARLNPKPTTGLEDVNAAGTTTSDIVYQGVDPDQSQTFTGANQFWIEDDGRQIWQVAADGGILSVQSMPAWDCSDPLDFGYIGEDPSGSGENTEGDVIAITYGTNVKNTNEPSLIEVRLGSDATGQVVQDATTSTGFVYGENTYRVKFSLPSGWSGQDLDGNKACVQTNVTVVQNDPLYDCDVAGPTINSGTHGDPVVVQWAVAPADNTWVVTPSTLIPGSAYTITGIEVPAGYSNNGGAAIQCQIDANDVTVATTTLAAFDCTAAAINISPGLPGDNVAANTTVAAGITISSISPAVFSSNPGTNSYTVNIQVPATGYSNSGQILVCSADATTGTVTKTISLNNTSNLTFDSTGTPIQTKIVTIEGNATGFSTGTHIQYTAGSNSWLNVSLDNFTTSGGNLQFSANAYTGAQPRSVTVQLAHPEDNSIKTTTFTITQSAGNQPPTGSDFTKQITWSSTVADIDLDFTDPAASTWNGTAINDPEDGSLPDVIITDITGLTIASSSATLKDNSDGSTDITSSSLPYTLAGTTARTIKLTPYAELGEFQSAAINFKYKVKDSEGLESSAYTVTLTVQPPANTAPLSANKTISITNAQNGNTSNFAYGTGVLATDEDASGLLTYKWVDGNGGGNPVTFVGSTRQGAHGTFVEAGGVLQYTYTGPTLTPNDNPVDDDFWFTATDTQGLVSLASKITVTMTSAANTPPVISINNNTGQNSVTLNGFQYEGITLGNISVAATDGDNNTLTWSAAWDATNPNNTVATEKGVFSINPNNGAWVYSSGDWEMLPNTPYNINYIVTVSDPYNGEDSYNIELNLTGVSYISGCKVSTNGKNTSATACDEAKTLNVYLDAALSTSLDALDAAEFIYTENTLQESDKLKPVDASTNPWFSIQQDIGGVVTVKAVKLAADGAIEQIFDCEQTLDRAWPIDINYSTKSGDLCQPGALDYTVTQATVYQNVIDPDVADASLQSVINAGGQLFTSQYYANQGEYLNNEGGLAPASLCVAPGFYNDDNRVADDGQIIYYEFTTNAEGQGVWNPSSVNDTETVYEFNCPVEIEYSTYKFNAFYNETNRSSVDAICLSEESDLTNAELYVRLDAAIMESEAPHYTTHREALKYVMKNQVLVYKTEADAEDVNYNGLWETTVFVALHEDIELEEDPSSYVPGDLKEFAIWDNENDSGYIDGIPANNFTYSWVGSNTITYNLEYSTTGTELGNCGFNFVKPDVNSNFCLGLSNNDCTTSDLDTSRTNVFYAFYSCASKVEGGDPYWNLYLVDGLHTFATNSTSYIKKLIDVIEPSKQAGLHLSLGGDTMLECVTLQHKIFAVNHNDATTILLDLPEYGGDIRVVEINPVELGFASGAEIEYRETCVDCILDVDNASIFTMDPINDSDVINRSLPNFDLEKNYELDNLSKPLLRTNPKLSTNAKLVVNSNDNMFIESIDATKELASVEYKKWPVNKLGKWSYDLSKFFNNNKTPSDIVYFSKSRFSDFTVQESFEKQIEEDYHYGTTYNYSKLHDEDFRMLAPIWLDKNIPSNFVIFRVSDPAAVLDFDTQSNFSNINEILKNSELIKTFDLTRDSNIGTYLRNHVQSELFPKNPISVNFSENERTNFNGIDLVRGGFTNKGEYLFDDFVKQDQTVISENELITAGFERNKLACANLINLEFLFDDDAASDYAVNRYFGLYVNDVDSGYGSLESSTNGLLKFKTLNSHINEDPESAIPPVKLMSSTPTLGYAHISDKFYKISTESYYDTSNSELKVEDSANLIPNEIKLAEVGTSIDIINNAQAGSDFIKLTINGAPANNDRISIFPSKEQDYRVKFVRYNPGDTYNLSLTLNVFDQSDNTWNNILYNFTLVLKDTMEQTISDFIAANNNTFDDNLILKADGNDFLIYEKKVTLNPLNPAILPADGFSNISIARVEYTQVPYDLENNMYFGSDALSAGHFNTTAFSTQGTNAEIAQALVKSINSKDNGFTALTYDGADHLYIKNDIVGYRLMQSGIAVPNNNANDWVTIDSANEIDYTENNRLRLQLTGSTSNTFRFSKIYFFNGGNSGGKSVLASLDSVADINVNDYLETSSNGVYNKVIDIVDDIERLPLQYKKLILEKTNTLEDGEVNVFADNLVRLGLFSAFDIHDMNFDFYDTANSDLKELQWEVANNINYEPEIDNQSDIYPFGDRGSSDYLKSPVSYFTGLSDVLEEERTDDANETQVLSEYDRLQENYLKEYAIQSRVVPSINKWVLKDTLTVREQPYYLNANEAFGRSNFSADLSVRGRNRVGMTHEWFYINNLPKYLKENQGDPTNPQYRLNESFSYLNFMEGVEMSPSMFKDVNYDYFDRFFVTEGFETTGDNKYKTFVKTNRQKKYTLVNGGNDTAFADTIFKGLKVIFKNRKEFNAASPVDFVKSSEFNGYRFSTVLNVKTSQDSNGIEYEVIQNKKFKYVVFFISLNIDDLWADQTLTRKLLYELNHSLVWNNEEGTFKYSDIKVDGHLDLTGANFSNPDGDDYLVVNGLVHADGKLPQFLEQINKNDDDEFGSLIVEFETPSGPMKLELDISNVESQTQITLSGKPRDLTNGNVETDLSFLPGYVQYFAKYTYKGGGVNAYKYILESLGAQDMADMLLRNPDNIKYSTIELDGSIGLSKFIILLEDGVEFIKKAELDTEVDDEKPESFKLSSGNIGYNLGLTRVYYPFLIRHNGGYTIDTTPVVTFTDVYTHMKTNTLQNTSDIVELQLEEQMYKHSLTSTKEIQLAKDYYRRYNRCGVAFNLGFIFDGGAHDTEWGYIKNHFYRKVNEFKSSGVIKLSVSSDKPPLYPLIGEIAIDKKDVNVFKSSWDKNYYTRSLSGGINESVPGTFETKEERSYLASTIMKIKDSYTMLDFEVDRVKTEEELDDILANSTNKTDVVLFEDKKRVVMDFYIDFTINKKLSGDGVLNTIKKYVLAVNSAADKTTLTDDAQLYIRKNLINVFNIDQIKLYTQRFKGGDSTLEIVDAISNLDDNNYNSDQNFAFSSHEQKPLNFRLIYNKRLGYSYRIRPMVKITS